MNEAKPVHYFLLALCLAGAFALRYPGIRFGFPLFLHPDDPQITVPAMRIASGGGMNPRTFVYPSLPIYTQAAVYRLGYSLGVVRKTFHDFSEVPPLTLHFWGRLATIVFSLAVVWLVWRGAAALSGPTAGLVAALVTTVSLLQVESSFSINPDMPFTLWAVATYLATLSILSGTAGAAIYLAAGVFAGLAMSSSYTGVFAVLPLLAAHFLRPEFRLSRLFDAKVYLALVIAVVTFVATTPYLVSNGSALLDALAAHRTAYGVAASPGPATGTGPVTSYSAYAGILMAKFGPFALGLAAVGLLAMLIGSWSAAIVTAAFPAALFTVMGAAPLYFEHNMVCLVPFLAIFAGTGAAWVVGLGGDNLRPTPKRLRAVIVTAVVALGAYTQVRADVAYTRQITLPDTRAISKTWIEDNLPSGATIAREAYTPPINPDKFHVKKLGCGGLARAFDVYAYDYLIASSRNFASCLAEPGRDPTRAARYQDVFKAFPLIKSFTADGKVTTGPSIFIYRRRDPKRRPAGSSAQRTPKPR